MVLTVSSDILVTPLDQFHDRTGRDPVWEKKKSAKLVWVREWTPAINFLARQSDRNINDVFRIALAAISSDTSASFRQQRLIS